MSERMTRMERIIAKVSSKTGQIDAEVKKSYSPAQNSRRGTGNRGNRGNGRQNSARGRGLSKKEEPKSGSRASSKKRPRKTRLSKLPADLLQTEERERFKQAIRDARTKAKVDKNLWDTWPPQKKALHNLELKQLVDAIVAKRSAVIYARAEERVKNAIMTE